VRLQRVHCPSGPSAAARSSITAPGAAPGASLTAVYGAVAAAPRVTGAPKRRRRRKE